MTLTRSISVAFAVLLFGGCVATLSMPPGGYQSDVPCNGDAKCKVMHTPVCKKNEKMCYQGRCVISDIPNCVPPVATTTATVTPVPTLSPAIEQSAAPTSVAPH